MKNRLKKFTRDHRTGIAQIVVIGGTGLMVVHALSSVQKNALAGKALLAGIHALEHGDAEVVNITKMATGKVYNLTRG